MLRLGETHWSEMVGHAFDELPLEACGLLAGHPITGKVEVVYRLRNVAESAKNYEIGRDYGDAEDDAERRGLQIIGVFHSHTHTEPYPSPTDVQQAFWPEWHYVIVSMKEAEPMVRSFRVVDGQIREEPVVLERR